MRLNTEARALIVKLSRQYFGADARVWLFGSRLDDKALGGDIDLRPLQKGSFRPQRCWQMLIYSS